MDESDLSSHRRYVVDVLGNEIKHAYQRFMLYYFKHSLFEENTLLPRPYGFCKCELVVFA